MVHVNSNCLHRIPSLSLVSVVERPANRKAFASEPCLLANAASCMMFNHDFLVAQAWCNDAPRHDRKWKHGMVRPQDLPIQTQQLLRLQRPDAPGPGVLADDVLDGQDRPRQQVARGKAEPKPKAKPKPKPKAESEAQPKAKAKQRAGPKAKPQAKAQAAPASSSSSSSSSTSSRSSSSSSS